VGVAGGVGDGTGVVVGIAVGVAVAVGVGVAVAVGVGVAVAVGLSVGVAVGGGADGCAQYRPPVFWGSKPWAFPPQTIISLPVQTVR